MKSDQRKNSRRWILPLAAVVAVVAILAVAAFVFREREANKPGPAAPPGAELASSVSTPDLARGEITVAKSGDSDFDSIDAALASARPGTVIRVLDAAQYEGPIVINDAARWSGVQLIADDDAVLRASNDTPVVSIHATPEVVVSGFHMQVGMEQHGIDITGSCPGAKIQDLHIQRTDDPTNRSSLALIYLHTGAMGTEELPIVIERVVVREGNLGLFMGEQDATALETKAPTGWIKVRECDFVAQNRFTGYHVILASNIENVQVTHNLFSTAACGVSLSLPEANHAHKVTIEHNTFYDLNNLLVLNDANLAQDELLFQYNLVHGDTKPLFDGELVDMPPSWFKDNYWLDWPGTSPELEPIAKPLTGFDFSSANPAAPDYLHVTTTANADDAPTPFPGRYELSTQSPSE